MSNPFMSVFTDTADFSVDNELSTETVTISLEEYEHLLLRVATAERMYADSKDHVAWLEKVVNSYHERWCEELDSYMEVK